LPPAEWGPAYSATYALVNLASPDRARLFDVHWALLVGATVLGVYVVARGIGQTQPVALAMAAALLATCFFDIEPFPGHFALVLLLVGCVAALRCPTRHGAASVLLATLGCVSFVRPEATPVFLGFGVAFAALSWLEIRDGTMRRATREPDPVQGEAGGGSSVRAVAVRAALALAPALALAGIFGNPLGGGRGFGAFAQHYAFTETRRNGLPGDPWLNYEALARRDFGDASTVAGAFRANPGAAIGHVLYDLRELPGNVLDLCALRSRVTEQGSVALQAVSAVVIAVALAGAARVIAKATRRPRETAAPVLVTLGFFLMACAAELPASLIVFPRAHYLVAPCAFGWILGTWGVAGWARRRGSARVVDERAFAVMPLLEARPTLACALVLAVAWLLVPTGSAGGRKPTPKRQAVEALRALDLQPGPIFEAGPGFAALAGYDSPTVSGWEKNEPLLPLLARRHIRVVILWDRYLGRDAFAKDPDVAAFLAAPASHGYDEVFAAPGFLRVYAAPGTVRRP
jgi:hypothetical protein